MQEEKLAKVNEQISIILQVKVWQVEQLQTMTALKTKSFNVKSDI